jgi:hypothetical protein
LILPLLDPKFIISISMRLFSFGSHRLHRYLPVLVHVLCYTCSIGSSVSLLGIDWYDQMIFPS